jgi:hypothetical protein
MLRRAARGLGSARQRVRAPFASFDTPLQRAAVRGLASAVRQRRSSPARPRSPMRSKQLAKKEQQQQQSVLRVWSAADVPSLSEADANLLCESTLAALPKLGGREFVALAASVTRQGVGASPPWERLWRQMGRVATPQLLSQLNGSELASLVHAFASVECRAPRLFDAVVRVAQQPSVLRGCTPRALCTLAHSFAVLGAPSAHLLPSIGACAADAIADFQPGELGVLMWSAAVCDVSCSPLYRLYRRPPGLTPMGPHPDDVAGELPRSLRLRRLRSSRRDHHATW